MPDDDERRTEPGPLGSLPPADPAVLVDPPLELAVAEIRFLEAGPVLGAAAGLALRRGLADAGYDLVRMEAMQHGRFEISLQQGAAPESRVQGVATGWQLQDVQGQLQVTAMPEALVVQTSRYERWSTSMRPLLESALTVAREVMAPRGVARIGLRYIDRFTDPDARTPEAWRGRIHDSLLGPVCHPVFGPSVASAQQQVELGLEPAAGALLRHGPFVDPAQAGAVSYLLDIDVFDQEPRPFDVAAIVTRAQVLNRTAFSLFQHSFTPKYLAELGTSEVPPSGQDDEKG